MWKKAGCCKIRTVSFFIDATGSENLQQSWWRRTCSSHGGGEPAAVKFREPATVTANNLVSSPIGDPQSSWR